MVSILKYQELSPVHSPVGWISLVGEQIHQSQGGWLRKVVCLNSKDFLRLLKIGAFDIWV